MASNRRQYKALSVASTALLPENIAPRSSSYRQQRTRNNSIDNMTTKISPIFSRKSSATIDEEEVTPRNLSRRTRLSTFILDALELDLVGSQENRKPLKSSRTYLQWLLFIMGKRGGYLVLSGCIISVVYGKQASYWLYSH